MADVTRYRFENIWLENFSFEARKKRLEEMLGRFSEVQVVFVRYPGLVVPSGVMPAEGEGQILSYGLDLPVPIPDLEVTDSGISATLSFNRSPFKTFLPWGAVLGIRVLSDGGTVVPDANERPRPKLRLVP